MQIVQTVREMRELGAKWKRDPATTVAFVPTMGALHRGHLKLVEEARGHGNVVVMSSFVNPLQFNDPKDLARYPRTPDEDRRKAAEAGVTHYFEPEGADMFPPGYLTTVNVSYLAEKIEGASRPGHFRGVTTVVARLFNIVQPDVAVFGRKDAQQLVIIRKMVEDLAMDVRIVDVPTVREADGLAMSSRNALLNPAAREQALCLSRALKRVHFLVKKQGITHSGELLQAVRSAINSAGPEIEMDYARIVSRTTLEDIGHLERGNTLVLLAARAGGVRLIDCTYL